MIRKGLILGLGVIAVVITAFLFLSLSLESDLAKALASLVYLFSIGVLGYSWKKKNGSTYALFGGRKNDSNDLFLRYSFGVAVIVVCSLIPFMFALIHDIPWWPLALLILIPFVLLVQTVHIAFIAIMGGWFYKNAT